MIGRLALLAGVMLVVGRPAMAADAWNDLLTVREDRTEIRREAGEIAREDHALRHQLKAGNSGGAASQRQALGREAGDLAHARARLDHDEREIAQRHRKQRS